MKVIIRLGDKKYYTSKVFAIKMIKFNNLCLYQYLVFNQYNEKLIFQDSRDYTSIYIDPLVLIYDNDSSDMQLGEDWSGKVNFISNHELEEIVVKGTYSKELLTKCKKHITTYNDEYIHVKNQKDINNLMAVAGGFHDGLIKEVNKNQNGELVVLFDELWGCKIEMIFSKDVEYNCVKVEKGYEFWLDAKMLFIDKKILLVDDACYKPNKIKLDNRYNWFKSSEVRYRIIPD